MYDGKRIIGIIPARGGSKGLPGKNIRPLGGKPLITWTIEQARASKYIDRVIVTTDEEAIASTARKAGADVPFLRPKELATDTATSIDVILHTLAWLKEHDEHYDIVVLLQPTSPLRTAQDIDTVIKLMQEKNATAIASVCETEHHPYWSNVLPSDGSLEYFLRPELINRNRQELPVFYRLNGAVYAALCDKLIVQRGFLGPRTFAYVMPKERSVDIDSILDFQIAEFLFKNELAR